MSSLMLNVVDTDVVLDCPVLSRVIIDQSIKSITYIYIAPFLVLAAQRRMVLLHVVDTDVVLGCVVLSHVITDAERCRHG